jgi:Putative peptidoglycan binding domain
MHQSVKEGFLGFNKPLEGQVDFMYLDVKSLVSTGVGNLLDADDPANFGTNPQPLPDIFTLPWFDRVTRMPASREEITQEYLRVKFSGTAMRPLRPDKEAITQLRITAEDIRSLVNAKLVSFEATLRERPDFVGFDDWPADGQLGLLSMAWAMGPLFRFPKFQSAAAAGDWKTMAAECRMVEAGNPGVIPRNVRNQLLFTIAWWVAAPPHGDFRTLVYDPNPSITLADNIRANSFPIPINLDVGVQAALERLGADLGEPSWNPNGLDGVYGPGTRAALVAYQAKRGLPRTPAASHVTDIGQATIDAIVADLDAGGISHWP